MISRWLVPVVCISGLITSCSEGSSGWAGTISDSAGVTIVSNPEQGIWAPGEEWVLEEELRIGGVEGDLDYLFGDIWGVTVDSRGRLYVLDFQEQHIQVYSPDGVYGQTLGGPGEGPGEFRGAVSLLMGPGDTLLVQDNRLFRTNRFAPDGSNMAGIRYPIEEGGPIASKSTPSGVIMGEFEARDNVSDLGRRWIVTLATDGTVLDTLFTYSLPPLLNPDGGLYRGARLYIPEMMWDVSNDLELVCGTNEDFRISIYSEGSIRRIITKPFHPIPVEDSDIEVIKDRFGGMLGGRGFPPQRLDQMWANVPIAESYPAFQGLSFGPWGTIWVQQVQPVSELNDPDFWLWLSMGETTGAEEWDVFDPEGRFLGVVTMPDGFRPRLFRGDKVYGTWYDEYQVPYVVRLGVNDPTGT